MKKLFGLALVPVVLAASPLLALAEKPAHPEHQPAMTQPNPAMVAPAENKNIQTSAPAGQTKNVQSQQKMQNGQRLVVDARINPQYARAQGFLVSADYPEALEAFQQLLSTEPNNVYALDGAAFAQYQQGRYDEALRNIERAISLDPVNAGLFNLKARILEAQNKPAEALEAYLTFTSLNPGDTGAVQALRRVDELNKQFASQLNEAQRHYLQGLRMLSLHQPEQAIPQFERYLSLNPQSENGNLMLGRAYLELGQPTKAIPYFQAVLKQQANHPLAYYQLGSSYELAGQTRQAQTAWQKFVEAAPQSEQALLLNRRLDSNRQ